MKVAIFDFDGTIVYSESLWIDTFDQFEMELKLPRTPKEVRAHQMTQSVLNLARLYYTTYEDVRQQYKSADELASYFNEKTEKKVYCQQPIEGVCEFIEKLHKNNIPIIIASSGRKEHIEKYLKQWNIKVNDIVTGLDVLHPKPSTDIYFEAMKRSRRTVNPNECFVFEDNPIPAINAHQAGFKVCMIKCNNYSIFQEPFDFADIVITNYIRIKETLIEEE
ncbi:2-deoxyglucose-6-phosphate phosphatase, putative [Entamoeba dispar SAW760]|uniref:2-deoxyglucose-6-phosphate phosphatase, putative n=1 Tax=Entamoeba dispar (strain ATCC PRA-260 / SAW760) TaxID=370354 RepID=B0E6N7_ENTDS|nr:2-deoxyglucose-6-phosphate phosphatase, putative [Entamoeba dispar SAW760]EDR29818.1 2-deoxyglucose-6-phosphate phosphatase, putative [Entamoeba dispar SAW760]|eukprot:EDR29818.1 2-deoxyglucose-6-phosphate phosphatase, putative [Entamoeba dispar SAW760]